jgi:hypothetical protein
MFDPRVLFGEGSYIPDADAFRAVLKSDFPAPPVDKDNNLKIDV